MNKVMNQNDYDMVLIAIERENIAEDIKKYMEILGILPEKIKWINPAVDVAVC